MSGLGIVLLYYKYTILSSEIQNILNKKTVTCFDFLIIRGI